MEMLRPDPFLHGSEALRRVTGRFHGGALLPTLTGGTLLVQTRPGRRNGFLSGDLRETVGTKGGQQGVSGRVNFMDTTGAKW